MNVNQQHPLASAFVDSTGAPSRRRSTGPAGAQAKAVALAAVVLAGCTSVPLSSLWALRQLDFATLDPAQLRAVALLPPGVAARPEAVRLTLKGQRGGGSAEVAEEHLVLRASTPEQTPPVQTPPGAHWLPLAFDEANVVRFNAFRSRLQAWKAADGKVSDRSFSVSAEPDLCSTVAGGVESGRVVVSAWMRWKAGQALLPLLDEASLKDLTEKDKVAARLPACT